MFVRQAARLVMISDPEREEGPSFDRELREAFGLSPAEAHLTGILVRGVGLPTAADELGISRHTAKAQLGAIFRKTETNSQARLIRLVLKTVSR
jgi:DNA-binding CsgD family transcriptional regulator